MKGSIFIFEGIDMVGKSTISKQVYEKLMERSYEVAIYNSPGKNIDKTLGSVVYQIHHGTCPYVTEKNNPVGLQMLHVASHLYNLQNRIIPDIEHGKIVLLDRFWWSTYAYGYADGISRELLTSILFPELLELEKNECIKTVFYIERNGSEIGQIENQVKIEKGYELLISESKYRVIRINNNSSIEKASDEVLKYIL